MSADPKKKMSDADARIGANVRKQRLRAGLAQSELAEKLGITFQQVQKYEIGKNRISGGRLVDLAKHLGCTLGDLFDGLGTTAPSKSLMSDNAVRLARDFDRVADERLKTLIVKTVALISSTDFAGEA